MPIQRFTKFLSTYFKYTNNIPLGRWHIHNGDLKQEIKILLANHDSCGAIQCNSPIKLKKDVDKITINK